MRKNGFTLIELLAVIVILAIIALIATPIILGIINDAREESNERSVELYASAVRNGIAAYQLREGKEVLPGTYNESKPLPFEVEYDGKVDCENVIISETGKVSLDKCIVNGGTKEYSYGIEEPSIAKVCSIEQKDENKYSVGDIVTCNIGETPDKFYVIADAELTASAIQMLTEKNIHTTEYRQSDISDNSTYLMFSEEDYWSLTTSSYPADVYNERNNVIKPIVDEYVNYLNTKLTEATGKLLTYSQAKSLGCNSDNESCVGAPNWLTSTNYWLGTAGGGSQNYTNYVWHIDNIYGEKYFSTSAGVCCGGMDIYGVRPVITISTNEIK